MANFKKNDEGVSAVIGVILMVAITVILAAVIAAFVFQLGNQMPNGGHTVAVQTTRISTTVIEVKTMSGDTSLLVPGVFATLIPTYTCTVATGTGTGNAVKSDGTAAALDTDLDASTVGSVMFFNVGANSDITIVAHYTDGSTSTAYSGKIA